MTKIQLLTGGAGKDYPWQVTDWRSIFSVDYTLPYAAYANRNVDYSAKPEFFFKYLGDGTLIPDNLGG